MARHFSFDSGDTASEKSCFRISTDIPQVASRSTPYENLLEQASELKRFAFNLRHQLKAKRAQRSNKALHFAKLCESGFSRNALEQPFWEFWSAGFEQAVRLRPEACRAYFDAEDTRVEVAFSCMCGLLAMQLGESSLPQERRGELQKCACNLIPEMVTVMNDWIKSQAPVPMDAVPDCLSAANVNLGPARSNKVGRKNNAFVEAVESTSDAVG
ncbi:hypothetical protein [Roseovarius sp.]|jgi:hypothetical protein